MLVGLALCLVLPRGEPSIVHAATDIPQKMSNTLLALKAPAGPVKPGDTFDVAIELTSDTPSRGAQAVLHFDPKLVEVVGVTEGTFYKDWAQQNDASTILLPAKPTADNQQGIVPTIAVALLGSMGQGPVGSGTLLVYQVKAKPGTKGNAEFRLSDVEVSDTGDATGRTQSLAGVSLQGVVVAIGDAAAAPAVQPTAVPSTQPTVGVTAKATPIPTVARRATSQATADTASSDAEGTTQGPSFPWEIAIPIVGLVVIGAIVVITRGKK